MTTPFRLAIEQLEPRRLLSTMSGTVFEDVNHNGLMDTVDTGIANRTVYLDVNNNATLDPTDPQTRSSSSGFFFINAPSAPSALLPHQRLRFL